jgi:hypothetical protein
MIIEAKYDIDDKVYFIHHSRIHCGVITSVSFYKFKTICGEIHGGVHYGISYNDMDANHIDECDVFYTKEELLNKLSEECK